LTAPLLEKRRGTEAEKMRGAAANGGEEVEAPTGTGDDVTGPRSFFPAAGLSAHPCLRGASSLLLASPPVLVSWALRKPLDLPAL